MTSSLAGLPMLRGLPPERLRELESAARRRRYPAGQILCTAGDPVDHLLVLLGGRVKASRTGPDGRELVSAVSAAPRAFDKAALIAGRPHLATLTALTPVEVAYLPRAAVLALVESEPAVAARLLRTLAETVCDLGDRLADIALLPVPARVASWLVRRAAGGQVPLHGGQSGLAAEVGATRVSVNRALKSLERDGLITLLPGAVRVLDRQALDRLAERP
ncbi:Crp/Fnr family transcriptional regulator [Bailinhaonella thermotolerans]|nr:Crp/Fnr family transcriptional regulator [Bailinhaonella thermotolerans]